MMRNKIGLSAKKSMDAKIKTDKTVRRSMIVLAHQETVSISVTFEKRKVEFS